MTDLFPAAQAVHEAAIEGFWESSLNSESNGAAAVLRAAADLLSKEVDAPKIDGSKYAGIWYSFDYLISIATELEQLDG